MHEYIKQIMYHNNNEKKEESEELVDIENNSLHLNFLVNKSKEIMVSIKPKK
jgi:hypothetical protein